MNAPARPTQLGNGNLMVAARPARSTRPTSWWTRHQRSVAPYLFLSPFAILFLVVLLAPFGFAAWLSTHEWNGFGTFKPMGLGNYRELFHSAEFWAAIRTTLIFTVVILAGLIPASLLLAVALHTSWLRSKSFYRSIFVAPTAVSSAAVAVVFILVFDPRYGLVNAALVRLFGGSGIDWIGAVWPARFSIMIVVFWRSLGLTVLFFTAGLQNISPEQIDAARVDGADGRRVFRHVTLPGLRPMTAFVTVVAIISMLQLFEEPFLLTGGGPARSTQTIVQLSYRAAFVDGRFGYAACIGVVLVISILIAAAVLALLRRLLSALEAHRWAAAPAGRRGAVQ